MSEVKKLNELSSGRVATNLGLDANGKLISEAVTNENYSERNVGAGATRWLRAFKVTSSYPAGIVFMSTGVWCGKPTTLVLAVNSRYDTASKLNFIDIKVLAGDSSQFDDARLVTEGTDKYLEVKIYNSMFFAKAIGIGLDIMPGLPVSTPAADAQITELTIIRETTT